jgi:hypothetical protein
MSEDLLSMLAKGLIGDSAAAQFITYVKNPERPVSAEEVLTGDDFIARIAAHRAQQRDDLLDASQTLMLAMLVRYRSSPEAAARVARYMQALGDERSRAVWKGLSLVAPHWKKALTEAAPARTKRSAKAPGAASR